MDYSKRVREYFFSVNRFSIESDTGYNYLHILPLYSVPKKPENSTEVSKDLGYLTSESNQMESSRNVISFSMKQSLKVDKSKTINDLHDPNHS